MAERDFFLFADDFNGVALDTQKWSFAETSAAGAMVTGMVDGASENGEYSVAFDNTVEVQNGCLYNGDILQHPIGRINRVLMRLKLNVATLDSATSLAWGITSDRNAAIDSIAAAILFRCIGSNAIVVESDDGTHDVDDEPTGRLMSNAYHDFVISLANLKDVKFSIDGQAVAPKKVFDMSGYTGAFQPFVQLQKTADSNVDGFTIDYFKIEGRRGITRPA